MTPLRGTLVIGFCIAAVAAGAQTRSTSPELPGPAVTYSAEHWEHVASKDPKACQREVDEFQDQIGMRIQHAIGMENRGSIGAYLQMADTAGAAGDSEHCWYWFDRAHQVVR